MFFVVGITWIAEVISFLLNYGFGYNNVIAGDGGPSGHTNAIIIKASFLFDCVNAFQGIIMFCVLFFDRSMMKRIGKLLTKKEKKNPVTLSCSTRKVNSTRERGHGKAGSAVNFDHHAQQLTIRTNRTWRTPSPQPSPGGSMPPITTQVEVTEEYCTSSSAGIGTGDKVGAGGGLEIAKFAMKTRSGSSEACGLGVQEKNVGTDRQVTTVDFTMQFP